LNHMRQSQLFAKILRENPKDEKSKNAQFLIRGSFIYKEMAGVYTYLPLGLRVLRKIENVIRQETEKIGGKEILMTVFQPKKLWEETGRWNKGMGEVMYKCKEDGEVMGLGPTHEEMLTDIVRHYISSYKDLPLYLYQIQTKFRKELRVKSGLLRGREFDMKDLYSFHASAGDLRKYYQKVIEAYLKIFKRCGLDVVLTEAGGGDFTKDYTHEFQVIAPGGEDAIVYCPKGDFSQNKEIAKLRKGDKCPFCKNILEEAKSIEVGNIFPLGTKYSEAMGAYFIDQDGKKKPLVMGCYGLGPSRTLGAVVEVHHDEKGIIWPPEVAPFLIHLVQIGDDARIKKASQKLYEELEKSGVEVLYDDRENKTAGEKFAEADLIGIPLRMVVSEKTLKGNSVEIKKRDEKQMKLVKISQALKYVQ
jgi:prolyl-tRNA synthetase